jgi:hypothetical protein
MGEVRGHCWFDMVTLLSALGGVMLLLCHLWEGVGDPCDRDGVVVVMMIVARWMIGSRR